MFVCLCEAFLTDTHKNQKKKGKKKLTFHLPSDDERKKNALLDDTARLHPLPLRNKKKTRDYEPRSADSISPERESRLVPNDSPSRREERRLFGAIFWIFETSGCERLSPSLFLL